MMGRCERCAVGRATCLPTVSRHRNAAQEPLEGFRLSERLQYFTKAAYLTAAHQITVCSVPSTGERAQRTPLLIERGAAVLRRSSPAGQCCFFRAVLYCEALVGTALCRARQAPGSLTTEQCVNRSSQDERLRLTGACRKTKQLGGQPVSVSCPSDQPLRWKERWMYKPTVTHIEDPSSCDRILLRDEKKHSWSVFRHRHRICSSRRTSMESLILAQDERWRCA